MFFRRWFRKAEGANTDQEPESAYDRWAQTYDQQPGNLMLDQDELVFTDLMAAVPMDQKNIIDYGCGTGRHWPKILSRHPASLTGYDVSKGMLAKLSAKFPGAVVFQLKQNQMPEISTSSVDILVSTLTMAHIEDPKRVFSEWNRVLKPGGDILVTDYHPAVLAKGGKRTFSDDGKLVSVKNYLHAIPVIREMAGQLGWMEIRLIEKILDDPMKIYYEQQNALAVFEKFRGLPLIYGFHLKRPG